MSLITRSHNWLTFSASKGIVKKTKNKKKKQIEDALHGLDNSSDDDSGPTVLPFMLPKLNSSSVYSHLNHVYFNDDISYETVFTLNKELRTVEAQLKTTAMALNIEPQPIYLHITTHGGCIHAAFSAVDCIEQLSLPVYTVAEGFVASAGTLITLAGEKRFISANAYMLIHELRSGVWGKMTSIDEEYLNLKKVMDHIVSFYIKKTNITKKTLEKILTKDIIWNAEECIDKGLVESVYTKK
jgi:ATP-dependent Clp protease protease subunit